MAEYISKEAALNAICEDCNMPHSEKERCHKLTGCSDYYNVSNVPAADVVPAVRGKWMVYENLFGETARCTNCGFFMGINEPGNGLPVVDNLHFCPNCGARMDGDADA